MKTLLSNCVLCCYLCFCFNLFLDVKTPQVKQSRKSCQNPANYTKCNLRLSPSWSAFICLFVSCARLFYRCQLSRNNRQRNLRGIINKVPSTRLSVCGLLKRVITSPNYSLSSTIRAYERPRPTGQGQSKFCWACRFWNTTVRFASTFLKLFPS